jgi:hypothetical protein
MFVQFNTGSGDGTVPEGSAANLDIDHTFVSLHKHETIFEDAAAKLTLGRILRGDQLPDHYANSALSVATVQGQVIAISSVGISVLPSVVAPSGQVKVDISLSGPIGSQLNAVPIDAVSVEANGRQQRIDLRPAIFNKAIYSKAIYTGFLKAGAAAGPVTIKATIPGLGSIEDYFSIATGQ